MEDSIYISNLDKLNQKIEYIKKQGKDKLHVVSDFDKTLTKVFDNGKKISPPVSLIRAGGYLTPDYPKQAYVLFDKYHPYEIDLTISFKERSQKMREWWEEHRDLLIKSRLNKQVIQDIVHRHPYILREYTTEFFKKLYNHNIPILIFSASIGNLIEEFLKNKSILTPNVYILSNTFVFDEQGYAVKYKNQIIHSLNKSETDLTDSKYINIIKQRSNAIVLGDKLSDVHMVNKLRTDTVIFIGFLNSDVFEKLEEYKKVYDIIITNDSSMKYVYDLLNEIIGK